MVARLLHILILVAASVHWALTKPYPNYGIYDPFPPQGDPVYSFSPLEDRYTSVDDDFDVSKSRETRDLSWRKDFDEFIDGTKEPSCKQLREMWHLERSIRQQQRSALPSGRRDDIVGLPSFSLGQLRQASQPLLSPEGDGRGPPSSPSVSAKFERKSNQLQSREDEGSEDDGWTLLAKTGKSHENDDKNVRDPAKEIYGILRERDTSSSSGQSRMQPVVYGTIRTHQPPPSDQQEKDYFRMVHNKLLEEDGIKSDDEEPGDAEDYFGVVRYYQDEKDTSSPSAFEKVRAMLEAERGDHEPDNDPFEAIKEKLMNTPMTAGSSTRYLSRKGNNKAFRRRSSKKRRRNVRRGKPIQSFCHCSKSRTH